MKNKIALLALAIAIAQPMPALASAAAFAAIVATSSAQVAANNRAKESAKKIDEQKAKAGKAKAEEK